MKFKNIPDGTYNQQMKPMKFRSGYSVSINRPEISKKDINKVIKHIGGRFGESYIGVYMGCPETSYRVKDLDQAMHIARASNQYSVWDWKNKKEILNPYHNPKKKINGDYIIKGLNFQDA